jgi:hypothetical protein
MPRPCDHPTGDPRPDACKVCRKWVLDPKFRALCERGLDRRRGAAPPKPPPAGPGTELRALLAGLGQDGRGGCSCAARVRRMDEWGVAGCKANRAEIVGWLREERARVGWWQKARAAVLGVAGGAMAWLDPRDPLGSLVDEAIRRAEAKAETA